METAGSCSWQPRSCSRCSASALVLARLGVDRLPGTIHWKPSENVSVTLPVLLMVIVSMVGTIVLNVFFRR